jgi:hypothetical protein
MYGLLTHGASLKENRVNQYNMVDMGMHGLILKTKILNILDGFFLFMLLGVLSILHIKAQQTLLTEVDMYGVLDHFLFY